MTNPLEQAGNDIIKEIEFQRECERIVAQEVWCCVSSEVGFILGMDSGSFASLTLHRPFTWDDVENLRYCPTHGKIDEKCANTCEEAEEDNEVLEWWKVSDWLLEKLAAKGEPVIRDYNIWGRCTSGQQISADHVIREIVKELHNDKTTEI